MPELLAPLAVSLMIFFCTFAAAVSSMVLRKKLPDDHLSEDSKDVIKLVMGLIATMAALVLGLLIASANSSYEMQSGELQQVSASIVELDGILGQYGPEANESRHRLRETVSAAVDRIWSKDGLRLGLLAPATIHAEAARFYDSVAKLSPNTEAQRFIQKRALEISGAIRQTRALMLEQTNSSIPWPFLTVLVFWISMLFVGFGLFARANTTVIVALLIGALSVSSAIFLILELDHPYLGLMRISGEPLRNALAQIDQ
jgi:amino acid transporter